MTITAERVNDGSSPQRYKIIKQNTVPGFFGEDGNPLMGYTCEYLTKEELLVQKDNISAELDIVNQKLTAIGESDA